MKAVPWLFIIFPLCVAYGDAIFDVPVHNIEYSITDCGTYDRITMSGSFCVVAPGTPELPGIAFHFLLGQNDRLTDIEIIHEVWDTIPGEYYLYPKQEEHIIDDEYEFFPPDPAIYGSDARVPTSLIVSARSGNLRGYQIAHLSIVPFRYTPQSGVLEVLRQLTIKIITEARDSGVAPTRQTQISHAVFEQAVRSLVVNKTDVRDPGKQPRFSIVGNPDDAAPTLVPSLLGAPVDYLIITTDSLYPAYMDFAQFKKRYGFNTAVRTLSWINGHYAGIDNAERIRNFITDAVQDWGTSFVLLGGDITDIPARTVWFPGQYWQHGRFPGKTDHYFVDLDGTWNADGDEKFCEVEDSLDLDPDVYVGRLPTSDAAQVPLYMNKLKSYLQPVTTTIQARALFFMAYLDNSFPVANRDTLDSYKSAKRIAQHLPAWFDTVFLRERPKEELGDSLRVGFGIVTGLGHGGVYSIQTRRFSPTSHADLWWFDSLDNTDRYPIMFWISCLNQTLQSNCLGKHWVFDDNGCGIASIGPSYYSDAAVHEQYTKKHFDKLFDMPLAASLAESKVDYIGVSASETWYRIYQFSLNLFGDAALIPWDSVPQQYSSVSISPETINVGLDSVTVTVDPSVSFDVIFYKEGEIFKRDSAHAVEVTSEVRTESAGYLLCTVTSDGYVTHLDSVVVVPQESYLVYDSCIITDTLGSQNGDGVVNAGEDIELTVVISNRGSSAATGIAAQITCADSFVAVVNDTSSYPDILADSTAANITAFHYSLSDSVPDQYSLDFELIVDHSGGTSRDSFQLLVAAPSILHYTQEWVRVGDTFTVVPSVVNYGQCAADTVTARISIYPGDTNVVIVDSVVDFPVVMVDSVVSSEPDSFLLYVKKSEAPARYNYRVYDRDIEVVNSNITLATPPHIDSIWVQGNKNSIAVEWSKVDGAVGYRVYRASVFSGPYTFMRNHLAPVCRYEDFDVVVGEEYYYYVGVVDSSMNHDGLSDTVIGRTNPPLANGWPQTVYGSFRSSPAFGDIDPDYDGTEVLASDMKGNVWAWHCDGTPVVGDGRLFFCTPPLTYPEELWSTVAIGDVDNNGELEIVFAIRRASATLYVMDGQGTILSGWPKDVPGRVIGSASLADIDEDGDLEIFVQSELNGDVYAFHHDGSGVYQPSGLMADLPGYSYGTPAIGDINCDGDLEIVCLGGKTSDSLYVWDKNGNILAPYFPAALPDTYYIFDLGLADVLGDDRLEIMFTQYDADKIYLVDAEGNIVWTRPLRYVVGVGSYPVASDITGDGHPEILIGDNEGFYVFDSLGDYVPGFPDTTRDGMYPIVVNVDDNPDMEIIYSWSDAWRLRGLRHNGECAAGFPILYGDYVPGYPATYDLDDDGMLELIVAPNEFEVKVYDLETSTWDYPKFKFDPYNTGTYDRRPPSVPYMSTAQKIGQDVEFTWNTITTDTYGAPELMRGYVVYRSTSPDFDAVHTDSIGIVLQPDTTYRDVGVLNSSSSFYYCVRAVDWARNKSARSNVAYVFRKQFIEN